MSGARDLLHSPVAGRYAIEREIGRGGMATVYLARDLRHHRPVAVKVLHPEVAAGASAARFLREIRITSGLSHPHIVPLFDSGEVDGVPFYVMPLVEGESLRERLDREGHLPPDEAARIAGEVADALAYAHARGVVHRDVKPENVLLAAGHALVADFGVARALDAATGAERLTETGLVVGTPAYGSPEQAAGEREVDARSDVYSLGCVLYEMLAGRPAHTGATPRAVLTHVVTGEPTPLSALRPGLPAPLLDVVGRAMAKDRDARFPSADALAVALAAAREGADAPARPSARAPGAARRRALAGALAGALAAAGAAALWYGGVRPAWPGPGSGAGGDSAGATALAVLPFAVSGPPELGYLREGLVDVLSTKLDGVGELRTIDPRAVLGATAPGAAPPTLAEARAAAERVGAPLFVLGRVVAVGGRLQLAATLYERRSGDPAERARASAAGAPGALMELIDTVATRLVAGQPGGAARRLQRTAALTTGSLAALRHYLEGERVFRSGEREFDQREYRLAVEADPTFALAWYRLAVTGGWGTTGPQGRLAVERAMPLADRLPPRDRDVLTAYATAQRGAIDEAEGLYRRIVARYPDEVEAWSQLGELLFHHSRFRGRPITDAREPFERALALEPMLQAPRRHLLEIAARERALPRFDSLLRTAGPEIATGRRWASLRAAITPEGPERAARLAAALRPSPQRGPNSPHWVARGLAVYGRDLAAAAVVAAEYERSATTPQARGTALRLVADVEMARGRRRAAHAALAALARIDAYGAALRGALYDVLPFVPPDRAALTGHLATLRRLAPPGAGVIGESAMHRDAHAQLRAYLLASVALRLGDTASAAAHVRELESAGGPPDARALGADLARGVRARMAAGAGRVAEALEQLRGARMQFWPDLTASSPFYDQVLERHLRAELLSAAGRDEEALAWYATLGDESPHGAIFLAPAALGRASVLERRGDRAGADAEHAAAARYWRDCDPELRPLLARPDRRPAEGGSARVPVPR